MKTNETVAKELFEKYGKDFAITYCNEQIVSLTIYYLKTEEIIKKKRILGKNKTTYKRILI